MSNIETIGNNTETMIILMSNDGGCYSVDINTVKQCNTINNMLESLGDESDEPIPLPTIKGTTLKKVMTFCDYVRTNAEDAQNLEHWTNDRTFVVQLSQWFSDYINVEQVELFDIILAANFLDIPLLLHLGTKHVASIIRNKTPDELRVLFGEPMAPAVPVASGAGPA